MERKLAAIFSTDVAGYSRLMGDDEEATIRTLTAYRALISSLIQQYRGRVVDGPGDNPLAEFASVVKESLCTHLLRRVRQWVRDQKKAHRRTKKRTAQSPNP